MMDLLTIEFLVNCLENFLVIGGVAELVVKLVIGVIDSWSSYQSILGALAILVLVEDALGLFFFIVITVEG